jgi:hypothetical protein
MKLVVAAAGACAAILLAAGSAAASPPQLPAHGHDASHARVSARAAARAFGAGRVAFAPLGARLAGSTTISGTVLDSYGAGVANADVEWDILDSSGNATDSGFADGPTDTSGNWSTSTAVPAPSGIGQLWAYLENGDIMARLGLTWSEGTALPQSAGRLYVSADRGGPWADFSQLSVHVFGDAISRGHVDAPDRSSSPVDGEFEAQAGAYTAGAVNFFIDEGLEFSSAMTVTAFASSGTAATVDETDAQRITVAKPYWASGKPGSQITVIRGNFTPGWQNAVAGFTANPLDYHYADYGVRTSQSTATEPMSLKVPTWATPGYWYYVDASHVNGLGTLYLKTPFQVCTMKPSKSSVRKGAKIRVTGVVPVEGHWGSQQGTPTTVTLYAHKGVAGVPTVWNPGKGWIKVGSVRTNKMGAYTTPSIKPLKTLTLVVRYPGDDWYWRAFTSTAKVTVK